MLRMSFCTVKHKATITTLALTNHLQIDTMNSPVPRIASLVNVTPTIFNEVMLLNMKHDTGVLEGRSATIISTKNYFVNCILT